MKEKTISQTVNPVDRITGIGISLDAEVPQLAYWDGTPSKGTAKKISLCDGNPLLPPSAMLPRLRGEPIRADFNWPCHPRGSGQPWPPEAIINEHNGSGRFPLAYAWTMLADPGQSCKERWFWDHEGISNSSKPTEAIASVTTSILDHANLPDNTAVLIIPNHCNSTTQQEIIDFSQRCGSKIRLLWRPVAAAKAWCEHCHDKLLEIGGENDQAIGKVISLHCGFDCLDVTVLPIVLRYTTRGVAYFLPARDRPLGNPLCGFGIKIIEKLASEFISKSAGDADLNQLWNLMWSTPWMPLAMDILRSTENSGSYIERLRQQGFSPDLPQFIHRSFSNVYEGLARQGDSPLGKLTDMIPVFPDVQTVMEWITNRLKPLIQEQNNILGAVFTGPMADVLFRDKTIAERWFDKTKLSIGNVLCEGRELPHGILAQMAAKHSMRLSRGLPTYLDTLPRIKLVVTKMGEPVWEDLLKDDDTYVDGGKTWIRSEVGKGQMAVMAGREDIPIDLHHEEYSTVRTVTSRLPEAPKDQSPVSLNVSITPAQGNAQVEVIPDSKELFGRRRVMVDWGTMKDTEKAPKEWLDEIPRICPPVVIRFQSKDRYNALVWHFEQFLSTTPRSKTLVTYLHDINKRLQQKDPSLWQDNHYAFGSEGKALFDNEVVENMTEFLVEILKQKNTTVDLKNNTIRVLANMFTPDPNFQEILSSEIEDIEYENDTRPLLMAIGRCLRDSESIGEFGKAFFRRLRETHDLVNDWLRAFSEVIKYRQSALQQISSDLCIVITKHLLEIFEDNINPPENFHPLIFRHSCVGIVYLLRRRIYENDYLPPDSFLAQKAKQLFTRTKDLAKNGKIKLPGGMVNLQVELQNLIDYIDRRGRGVIVIAAID